MTAVVDLLHHRNAVDELLRSVSETTILPRYQTLSEDQIKTKSSPGDLVTIADEEAELHLTAGLKELLPGSAVVGEEAVAADPSVLERLTRPGLTWVIDPIDGTANFVAGKPAFGVIIALMQNGETVMGWIHNPLESKTLWAAQGQGAWVDSQNVTVAMTESPADVSSMTAALYHRAFRSAVSDFGSTTLIGSAAHVYWGVATGTTHVSSFSRLMPWDHAAGVLIHQEAGGHSALLDGTAYKPTEWKHRGVLSAPSREIWNTVRALADETKT